MHGAEFHTQWYGLGLTARSSAPYAGQDADKTGSCAVSLQSRIMAVTAVALGQHGWAHLVERTPDLHVATSSEAAAAAAAAAAVQSQLSNN
jgi:hypothetical protein